MDFPNIPAVSKYGHGATISAKITGELFSECQTFVQSGRFPYRTNSDLFRHALHRHLRALADVEPGLVNQDVTDVILELTRSEARSEQWARALEDGVKAVEGHLGNGRVEDATRFYQQLWALVAEMSPGEMQTQAIDRLQKYEFLKHPNSMSLRPSEAV